MGLSADDQQPTWMSLSVDVAQIEIDARAVMAGRYATENYDKSFMATRI